MEVMGLMLGQFVDDYTITCVDVFAMPQVCIQKKMYILLLIILLICSQHGTGVSVEAVDPVFQTDMLEKLKQTGRPEMVVGWYHSHPGFGCWLSGVDMNTQTSFEQLNKRAVTPSQVVYLFFSLLINTFLLITRIIVRLQQSSILYKASKEKL